MKKRYPTFLHIKNRCIETRSRFHILVLVLFLSTGSVHAQDKSDNDDGPASYIVNAVVYNKGVYQTFDEFKHNSPSVTNYTIEKGKLWKTYDAGPGRKIKKSKIWGYCSGEKIFVRRTRYNQILELGRYCYFRDVGQAQLYGTQNNNVPFFIPYKQRMIIDFNTGKITRLTTKSMKRILANDDPGLLAEFDAEPSAGKKLYEFLMKYNQRNKGRIK